MSDLVKKSDIAKGLTKNRKLTPQELDFCRWYSGSNVDAFGSACELDPIESAKRAGYIPDEAKEFVTRIRQDTALQLQIAIYNQDRRGETMTRLQSYSRRAADIVMELAESSENDNVRLGAAKMLMQVGGIGESPEEMAHRRKQAAATDEFRHRLDEIQGVLGTKEVKYTPFTENEVQPEYDEDGMIMETIEDEDDDIVG